RGGAHDVRPQGASGVFADVDALGADHGELLGDRVGVGHVHVADEIGAPGVRFELGLDLLPGHRVAEDRLALVRDVRDQFVPRGRGAVEFAALLGVALLHVRLDGQVPGLAGEGDRVTVQVDDRAAGRREDLVDLTLTLRTGGELVPPDRL